MTKERKQELRQLLTEAMTSLEIRRSGTESSLLPVEVYRTLLQRRWTFYSQDSSSVLDFNPYITNEVTKSKLLDFIRVGFAPFIHEDRIQSGIIFIIGGPTSGYPLGMLLKQLLKIAIVRGIEGAISAFDRCTEETHGSFQYIALLEGIRLEAEIQVFEGLRLVPLPHSTSELPSYLSNLSSFGPSKLSLLGKTVLIVDCSVSPIFCKPFSKPLQEGFQQDDLLFRVEVSGGKFPNFKVEDFYEKFCQALSLVYNTSVQIALGWRFVAEDELYNLDVGMVGGGFFRHLGPFKSATDAGETQIEEAKRLYYILVNLDSNIREKLQIPINRWIKSKASENPVDKMIDLGVAFETLYLSGIGATTELSFRFRLHAAWHLGKDKKCRKALMKEFREIYDWRSAVVHTGKLPKKKVSKKKRRPYTEEEVVKFIARAQGLCRQSIIKIMEDGRFPNWNDLILGGAVKSDIIALDENPDNLG